MKRRLLDELGLDCYETITQEKIEGEFFSSTDIFNKVDRSDEPDILAAIPVRSRAYAAAWLGGQDVASFCSRATLFRHAKICREYGLDILQTRSVVAFPTVVRFLDLEPVIAPDWYQWEKSCG